jgi:hypothetical protein
MIHGRNWENQVEKRRISIRMSLWMSCLMWISWTGMMVMLEATMARMMMRMR